MLQGIGSRARSATYMLCAAIGLALFPVSTGTAHAAEITATTTVTIPVGADARPRLILQGHTAHIVDAKDTGKFVQAPTCYNDVGGNVTANYLGPVGGVKTLTDLQFFFFSSVTCYEMTLDAIDDVSQLFHGITGQPVQAGVLDNCEEQWCVRTYSPGEYACLGSWCAGNYQVLGRQILVLRAGLVWGSWPSYCFRGVDPSALFCNPSTNVVTIPPTIA